MSGKGLYRKGKMAEYGWDQTVPFRSLNNEGRQPDDAPRAKKDDLETMYRYLTKRYVEVYLRVTYCQFKLFKEFNIFIRYDVH